MANITDQFVSSFSELYYSTTPIVGALGTDGKYTESQIQTWFSTEGGTPTQKVVTLTVDTATDSIDYTVVLDGITFTFTSGTGTTTTLIAAGLVTLIDGVGRFNATNTAGVITVTGVGIGDYSVVVPSTISDVISTAFVSADGTNLVPLVMEIGTLSNEATVIDTPTFGEVYKGKLRGQLDGGQLDAQLYWAPRNTIHRDLRDLAESGKQIYVGIKWKNESGDGGDSEFVYFDSFVSSFGIDTTFDDVAKVSLTLVVDGAEHFSGETV